MRLHQKHITLGLVLCGLVPCLASSQTTRGAGATPRANAKHHGSVTLTPDDGLSVIVAALDSHLHSAGQRDCSHLVHEIYDRAGFSYPYASSSDLYRGNDHFQRVTHPQPGDLVVWNGHVGIVVNPAQRAFFSTLGEGPGIDTYDAEYWRQRGPARFYRYIKSSSARAAVRPQ